MPRNKLTAMQERFAFNIASGFSQYDSYLKAGYSKDNSRAVIDINAHRLVNDNKIKLRINELQAPTETSKVLSVAERKEKLADIFKRSIKDPISVRDGLQAVDLLNKMERVYSDAPVTINNTKILFIIGKGYDTSKLLENHQSGILEASNNEDSAIVK